MKKFSVIFHTDTDWNGHHETVEAEDQGDVKTKLREKYGKIYIIHCTKL